MFLYKILGKDALRRHLLATASSDIMKHYLSAPFPDKKESILNTEIISLDIETTGLDPAKDRIVSIGLVEIKHLGVELDTCWHQVIKTNKSLPERSVVIHQITDDESAGGMNIEAAMSELLKRIRGKVVLVHNTKVEQGFINGACQELYGSGFVMPVIDTQLLAKRSFERRNVPYQGKDLRLFNLRKSLNLPVYKAHNALLDAIATAELFLFMVKNFAQDSNVRLGKFLC